VFILRFPCKIGSCALQDATDALELGVGHASGESADQAAVTGVAVLVVPLHLLGFVVVLAPPGVLVCSAFPQPVGAHLCQSAIERKTDGQHLCALILRHTVVERLYEVAGVHVFVPLQRFNEAVNDHHHHRLHHPCPDGK